MKGRVFTRSRIAAHAVVVVAGGALAWLPATREISTMDGVAAAKMVSSGARPVGYGAGTTAVRADLCRGTWELLLARRMPAEERRALQIRLLARWVEVDFDAAVAAALDQPESKELLGAFDEALRRQPEMFGAAIRDERFGDGTSALLIWWAGSLMNQGNPAGHPSLEILSQLEELGPASRITAVEIVRDDAGDEERAWFLDRLAGFPDTPENRAMWIIAGTSQADSECWIFGPPEPEPEPPVLPDLASRLEAADTPGKRFLLVDAIMRNLADEDPGGRSFTERFASLPEDLQPQIASRYLGCYPEVCVAADELIARGEWELLDARTRGTVTTPDAEAQQALATWAATLPDRAETAGLFQDAIRGYIRAQPVAAETWIGSLSSPVRRDQALIILTEETLNFSSDDPSVADRAIQRISDPALQAKAMVERRQWQERKDAPVVDPFAPVR